MPLRFSRGARIHRPITHHDSAELLRRVNVRTLEAVREVSILSSVSLHLIVRVVVEHRERRFPSPWLTRCQLAILNYSNQELWPRCVVPKIGEKRLVITTESDTKSVYQVHFVPHISQIWTEVSLKSLSPGRPAQLILLAPTHILLPNGEAEHILSHDVEPLEVAQKTGLARVFETSVPGQPSHP